jgi:hypothetical protein
MPSAAASLRQLQRVEPSFGTPETGWQQLRVTSEPLRPLHTPAAARNRRMAVSPRLSLSRSCAEVVFASRRVTATFQNVDDGEDDDARICLPVRNEETDVIAVRKHSGAVF